MNLKLLVFLLSIGSLGIGFAQDDQIPLRQTETTYPGFNLDLNSLRLVQLEGSDPLWMTELEKVALLSLDLVLPC
jgi:bacterial leucyl aminopeptidase